MTSIELDSAREIWLKEKVLYEEYGEHLINELKEIFKKASIPSAVSFRVKNDDSLLKKMLTKNKKYSELNDKVGARAVVHFLSDLELSDQIIQDYFKKRIFKRESKKEVFDDKTFGYLSIHYDIANDELEEKSLICELQLRTICQNTWSELTHILSYKSEIDLPKNIKREVNSLSALMEIADNQFNLILDLINKLPVSNPVRILKMLDGFFYTHLAAWYDYEMSYYFLQDVSKLYSADEDIIKLLITYINKNGNDIACVAKERKDIFFFSQPEIVIILERLENQGELLKQFWETKYPIDQLESIANAWGTSID